MIFNILSSSGLIVSITSVMMGIFVLFHNLKKPVNIYWVLFCLSVALWAFGLFMAFSTINYEGALFWCRFLNLTAEFITVLFINFVYAFLNKLKEKRNILKTSYIITILLFLISLTFPSFFVHDVTPKLSFKYYPDAGVIFYLFALVFFYFVSIGIFELYKSYLSAKGLQRRQSKYLFAGIVIGFVGGSTTFPLVFGIPLYPFGTWGVAIFVVCSTYAILAHQLFDIRVVLSRAAIFLMVYFVVLGIPLSLAFLGKSYLLGLLGSNWWLIPFILVIISASVGPSIYIYFQRKAEEILLQEQRSYQKTLKRAGESLNVLMEMDKLLGFIVEFFHNTLQNRFVLIYLFDKNKKQYLLRASHGEVENTFKKEFSEDEDFIFKLKERKAPIFAEEIFSTAANLSNPPFSPPLEKGDRGGFYDYQRPSVIIPIFFEDNLLGMIFLGEKLSKQSYTEDDLSIFSILSNQIAIALENAQLFEEKIKIEREAARSERLAAVGTMLEGIVHEVKNPLNALSINAEVVKRDKFKNIDELRRFFEEIFPRNIEKISKIASKTLSFAKVSLLEKKETDINKVLEGLLDFLHYEFRRNKTEVIKELQEVSLIKVDPSQVEQVYLNIILNAIQAMGKEGGRLTIRTREEGGKGEGGYVVTEISDTGHGIPKEDLDKIFNAFYTTKEEGTGLGLSTSYRIIEEHKGKIEVESEVNKGTTFRVKLPIQR